MSFIHILLGGVVDVLRVVFVERIVSQMNVAAIEIVIRRLVVLFGCEPCETFVIDIQSEWICPSHEYVDSKIKFELINKQWIFDILLDDILIAIENIFDISGEKNASALRQCFRLYDVRPGLSFFDALVVLAKLAELQGDGPGFRKKVVLVWVILFHSHESKSEEIFPRKNINAGVVIYFLMKVHAIEGLRFYLSISPPDIPISCSFLPLNEPTQLLCDFFNDRVLCVGNVDDYLFVFKLFA